MNRREFILAGGALAVTAAGAKSSEADEETSATGESQPPTIQVRQAEARQN